MEFNDLLKQGGFDLRKVMLMRHRPTEPTLRRALPWMAADNHELFNAYQSVQGPTVEKAMDKLRGEGYVASFLGLEPGNATFVGLYHVGVDTHALSYDAFHKHPDYKRLSELGDRGPSPDREATIRFSLERLSFYEDWSGKLVIQWPGGERSWWRRAHNPKNKCPVVAVHLDSVFDQAMPKWSDLVLDWRDLQSIPRMWQRSLAEWRGVYLICDKSDGKQYVGSAYGKENLMGRWLAYSKSGHGGNRWLKQRDPSNFIFSILQRVSPDLEAEDVIRIEQSWKLRLHTAYPDGLNDN